MPKEKGPFVRRWGVLAEQPTSDYSKSALLIVTARVRGESGALVKCKIFGDKGIKFMASANVGDVIHVKGFFIEKDFRGRGGDLVRDSYFGVHEFSVAPRGEGDV